MKRLLIVEESLRDRKAHWYSYIRTIAKAASNAGMAVDVACNRHADEEIRRSFASFPVFDHAVYLDQRKRKVPGERYFSFILHSIRTARALWPLLGKQEKYTEVFVPTVLVQHLLAWWMIVTFHRRRPKRVTLFFVTNPGVWNEGLGRAVIPRWAVLMKFLLKLFRKHVSAGRVRMGVETRMALTEFKELSGLQFNLFPHPVELFSEPIASGEKMDLKFCCYGFARHEKGSDLLAAAIMKITSAQLYPRVSFRVQWLEPFRMPDGSMCGPEVLKGNSRVTIIDSALHERQYLDLLKDTDCIVLPYRNSSYHARLSRVAIEAATTGIPMVYTTGGWLQEIVADYGAGAGMKDGSVDDLVAAIGTIAASIREFKEKAAMRAGEARRYYSGQRFVYTLLA